MDEGVVGLRHKFLIILKKNAKVWGQRVWGEGSSSNEACKTYPLLHGGCTVTERGPDSSRLTVCPFMHYLFLSGTKSFSGKVDKMSCSQFRVTHLERKSLPNQ